MQRSLDFRTMGRRTHFQSAKFRYLMWSRWTWFGLFCFVVFLMLLASRDGFDGGKPQVYSGNGEDESVGTQQKSTEVVDGQYSKQENEATEETTEKPQDDGNNISTENKLLEPLTIHCNLGRLGNQMCTFATLCGLSTLNHRKMSMLPCNIDKLKKYFNIDVPLTNSSFVEKNPWSVKPYLEPKDYNIPPNTNIIKGYVYPCSYTFFNHIRDEIKQRFTFRDEIQSYAEQTLLEAKGNRSSVTFVGLHVRRGDYIKVHPNGWLWAFEGREVDNEYFEKATTYFREKYSDVMFIVVSEDREWCRQNLTQFGVYITKEAPEPAYDMAILAKCNHTIMSYGTFGFWGAYLAGGETVYFDKFLKPGTQFVTEEFLFDKMYLPEWKGISTTKPEFWDTYKRPELKPE